MKKKLQVFISSTHDDMLLERQAVVEEILKCGHIPAGMELFGSDNKSQFDIIKNWISSCDVFLLILGGRYGSVPKDGRINKSYIHREYDYAKSIGKKPYALIMSDELIDEKTKRHIYNHNDPEYLKSDYKGFKESITDKKLCEFFSSIAQLKEQVNAVLRKCEDDHNKSDSISGWVKVEDIINNVEFAKTILEKNENDISYNPVFFKKFKKNLQTQKFLNEYYTENIHRLQESISHNTFMESYNRDITISSTNKKDVVQINTTTRIKYYHVDDSDYFSFNPRFNHIEEANSLIALRFLIRGDEKWSPDLTSKIKLSLVDHGENARWRYQIKHEFPLPSLKSFDDIEIIYEYRFYINQYDFFQMNQLKFPCENYSIRVTLSGLDKNTFPVVSSCSLYNVYSSSLFSPEQYKGSTTYAIDLPKWSLPGSGYFLTLQRKEYN